MCCAHMQTMSWDPLLPLQDFFVWFKYWTVTFKTYFDLKSFSFMFILPKYKWIATKYIASVMFCNNIKVFYVSAVWKKTPQILSMYFADIINPTLYKSQSDDSSVNIVL